MKNEHRKFFGCIFCGDVFRTTKDATKEHIFGQSVSKFFKLI